MKCLDNRSRPSTRAATLAAVALLAVTLEPVHAAEPNTCAEALSLTETANARTLFAGAELCAAENDTFSATLLLVVGQIRGMVDLTLLSPADESATRPAAELYQAIFYRYGGLGSDDVYSDHSAAERLIERIDGWSPAFDAQYDPGWSYRPSDRHALYAAFARERIDERLHDIRRRVTLLADPRYAALSQEMAALSRETQSTYTVGSEAYERHQDLQQRSETLEAEILAGFPPPPEGSVLDGLPPEIDPDVRNLYAGVNGPQSEGRAVFFDDRSVRASWIADALSEASLQQLLNEIDFQTEALVAVWIGRQHSASGTTLITAWTDGGGQQGWGVSVGVGVRGSDCEMTDTAVAYPFALAAVPKPDGAGEIQRHARSNFPDGCGPSASALPVPMP